MLIVILTCSNLQQSADAAGVWNGLKQPYQEFVAGC